MNLRQMMDPLQQWVDSHMGEDWVVTMVWDAYTYSGDNDELHPDERRIVAQERANRTQRLVISRREKINE